MVAALKNSTRLVCLACPLLTVDPKITATVPKATYSEETGHTICTRKVRVPLPLKRLPISYSFGVFDGYDSSLISSRFCPKADIEDASPSERRCLQTPPHLKSRFWRHLYRSYLMSGVIFCLQVSLVSLIRTRCLGAFLRRKSVTRRVVVKYIRFERE